MMNFAINIQESQRLHLEFSKCLKQSLIFANRFTKIHKDCQKDSQIFANLFVNLCESL